MRELLAARSGRDGIVASPPHRGRGRAAPSLSVRIASALAANPASVVGTLLVAGAGLAIGLNALVLQTARHPAPLFSERGQAHAPAPARRVEVAQRPEAQPRAEAPAPAPLPPARPATAYSAAPVPVAAPVPPSRTAGKGDAIGDLLRGGDATGAVPRNAAAAGSADPQRLVAGAQRALVRLGYGPLGTDGVMGPATRGAIERFERDRRLSPTGDLNPRTVRELTAAFGQPLE
ncbi:peptidoglycan-binding domain-containing protein [Salinarimonas soli]|uniref:Peptidoglycan-binding protein n=1 Tax=Salinarimonas soli TaxID=1638099 RepID=A0A5B2V9T6_9HYPH|nr:peptidoglycan-binding domain-containing protein [Salinarimonas soli]KAA2236263.1 peptidoglycan-binding protein [Salinarimonas soli]